MGRAPTCTRLAVRHDPQAQIEITVQDTDSGLALIKPLEGTTNAMVDTNFDPETDFGTTAPVPITATKMVPSQPAVVELEVRDVAGNVTTCDPVLTRVAIPEGRLWVSDTFPGIPEVEYFVTVHNGHPGVRGLLVIVNGTWFSMAPLGDDEERTIDVASAMVAGDDNTITLIAYGQPGTSASVIISDSGDPESLQASVGQHVRDQPRRRGVKW
jgi:hypothetical protein